MGGKMHERNRATLLAALLLAALPVAAAPAAKPSDSTGFDQVQRPYYADPQELPFQALPGATAHWGITAAGSGYRVEIPENWNGDLVVWVKGGAQFPGLCDPVTKADCKVPNAGYPRIREHIIQRGFAWASPTFREFRIAPKVRALDALDVADAVRRLRPDRKGRDYIFGMSLGGLTVQHAMDLFPKAWAGGLAGCTGDSSNGYAGFYDFTLVAMGLVADEIPEVAAYAKEMKFPLDAARLEALGPKIVAALGPNFPYELNDKGVAWWKIIRNTTGGARPLADAGIAAVAGDVIPGYVVRMTGQDSGARSVLDNAKTDYRWETKPGENLSPAERRVNAAIPRFTCDPEVCTRKPVQKGQMRNLGGVHFLSGKLAAPMMHLQATGEMMGTQAGGRAWGEKVKSAGAERFLVQRAYREKAHCGFNDVEVAEAFDDLTKWVETGVRAAGDDLTDPAKAAEADYGCAFTRGQHDQDFKFGEICRK